MFMFRLPGLHLRGGGDGSERRPCESEVSDLAVVVGVEDLSHRQVSRVRSGGGG